MENSSNVKPCPQCRAPISAEAPEGLCPLCLLAEVARQTEAGATAKAEPPKIEDLAAAFPQLEILEMIGRGGMGCVFRARQPKLDRGVALKVLPATLGADPAFAERFTQEGKVLARLNHPNIVTIHDFGQVNGFFYLMMELVDGVNLRQAMKAGRFTPAQALAIVPRICDALEFAHHEGILHRDIKPENILLDSRGRVKIADFGIAKILGRAGETTEPQVTGVIGTPQYMAPEQIEKPREVDQRADVYALGVVLYEMLTGELPLGRFAPPSAKSTVDPRLDEVVLRALEKEPHRRTATAGELKTQVETITGSAPPPAAGALLPPLSLPWFVTHLKRALLAGLAVFLLCTVTVATLTLFWPRSFLATARVAARAGEFAGYDPYRIQTEVAAMRSEKCLLQVSQALGLPERWTVKHDIPNTHPQAVNLLRKNLEIKGVRDTELVEIRFYSDTPAEAEEIANKIAETYCTLPPGNRGRIVDRATLPARAVRPNHPLTITIGALLGLAAGSLAFFISGLVSLLRAGQTPAAKTSKHRPVLTAAVILWALVSVGVAWAMTSAWRRPADPSWNAPQGQATESPTVPANAGIAQLPATTKVIELTKVMVSGDRISVWTDSRFPPGEITRAIVTKPDGSTEDAVTQTITIRTASGKQVSTVFSWQVPESFDGSGVEAARSAMESRSRGKPLMLQDGQPAILFTLTNRAGGLLTAALQLRSGLATAGADGRAPQASLRLSGVTNVLRMVLGYFDSQIPAGHVLEAGAVEGDGAEGEVHTSIAKATGYDNGSCRWDFPSGFTTTHLQDAVAQVEQLRLKPFTVLAGQRTRVFSVTNEAGRIYNGFFELSPAPEKLAPLPPQVNEIGRLRLEFAEQQLNEARARFAVGAIDSLTLEKAIAARDIGQADLQGDAVEIARINLKIAEMELVVAERKQAAGAADSSEYARAKLARDIALVTLQQAQNTHAK